MWCESEETARYSHSVNETQNSCETAHKRHDICSAATIRSCSKHSKKSSTSEPVSLGTEPMRPSSSDHRNGHDTRIETAECHYDRIATHLRHLGLPPRSGGMRPCRARTTHPSSRPKRCIGPSWTCNQGAAQETISSANANSERSPEERPKQTTYW